MGIDFAILGPLEVRADGRILPLGSPKQRSLLALLLVHANETVSRDRLIDELWGDAPPATVESGFHVYLSRLRRLLDSVGGRGALVRETHGYRLRVGPDQLDATRFESLVGEGNEALAAGRAELAAARFREALALWRGPALADVESEPFATAARARLEEARVSALEQRLEADLGLARHRQLIGELETLVSQHPYRERLRAQLMLALYRSGRQAEALRAYQEARRTLADVLGLEPGQGLKELEQAILRQDPILEVERPAEPEPPPRPATSLPIAPTPLIGRERELEEAARLLGAHRLVTLTGPGGSGKTRLALQLAADTVDAFPDCVVWVELQSLRDPELVLPTIARALGTDEMFSEGTADRHALLVLENFEQLLAAAPGVGDLPGRLPRSNCLSRAASRSASRPSTNTRSRPCASGRRSRSSSSVLEPRARDSSSPAGTPQPSPRSAPASTSSRSRSSSQRQGRASWHRRRCWAGSTSACRFSPAAPATHPNGTRRCGRRSTGATGCSERRSKGCSRASPSSRAAAPSMPSTPSACRNPSSGSTRWRAWTGSCRQAC